MGGDGSVKVDVLFNKEPMGLKKKEINDTGQFWVDLKREGGGLRPGVFL